MNKSLSTTKKALIAILTVILTVFVIVSAGFLVSEKYDSSGISDASYIPVNPSMCYEGITKRLNCFPVYKSVVVASGTAVAHMTADGTAGGASLCPNGVIQDSLNIFVHDVATSYQASGVWSNSNKTLTLTVNKYTGGLTGNLLNILNLLLGQAQANGASVKITVWCY